MSAKREPLNLMALRQAGACLHLTALPGPGGIGTLGAPAHRFVDFLKTAGLGIWQFLPTGPTAYGDSPYQPLSAFAGNPMLIDLYELIELGLLSLADLAPLAALPSSDVDYGTVIPAKTALLTKAAAAFAQGHADAALVGDYEAFCAAAGPLWLDDYALFRTLKTQHGERPWTEWPTGLRQRDPEAIARAALAHDADLNVIRFIQFVFYRQWQRLHEHAQAAGILLFGDMPIYIALDCADAWANRQLLRLDADGVPDAVAGVPPDYFSEDGQLWGNPLYDWPYHEDTDYAWWVERMRHTLSMVDVVRIDHFRGFEAYWAVPSTAATARTGAWETGPNDALFNAMRAALGPLPVVAEDLGAITPAVDELRRRQFMPGMSVLQFLIGDPAFDAESIRHDSVAYTGTHDNDTTVGWFHGGPGDVRDPAQVAADQAVTLERTGSAPADIHWGLIRMALGSAACLAIVPVQDFLGLGAEARFNTPGVPADNWRWRLQPGALDQALAQQIRAAVVEADR